MPHPSLPNDDPYVLEGVRPLLSELPPQLDFLLFRPDRALRRLGEEFVRQSFRRHHGAEINQFYPALVGLHDGERLRAVVGYRDAVERELFCEQYLENPAERVVATVTGTRIHRSQLVEVGNLALNDAGEARWVIAAMTLLLHELGYRWVLFTATRPLINAFGRLGLAPMRLADADPRRLPDGASGWGRYYQSSPVVCVGSIHAGYRKLHHHVKTVQPELERLLHSVALQARSMGSVPAARRAFGGDA